MVASFAKNKKQPNGEGLEYDRKGCNYSRCRMVCAGETWRMGYGDTCAQAGGFATWGAQSIALPLCGVYLRECQRGSDSTERTSDTCSSLASYRDKTMKFLRIMEGRLRSGLIVGGVLLVGYGAVRLLLWTTRIRASLQRHCVEFTSPTELPWVARSWTLTLVEGAGRNHWRTDITETEDTPDVDGQRRSTCLCCLDSREIKNE